MEMPALNLMSPYAFLHRPRFPDRDESLAVFITDILMRQKRGISANTAGLVGTRTKKDAPLLLMLNIRPNIMYIWENDFHCNRFLRSEKKYLS